MHDSDTTQTWNRDFDGSDVEPLWHRVPEPGQTIGGRFLLVRVLGAGGAGVVFEALDHATGETVAVKVLRPSVASGRGRERLKREVRAARPGHPNAVAVHDLHALDGYLLLSMELIDGGSLREALRDSGPLPINEVVSLGRQVAAALAYFHGCGLVHRDVKPGNILVSADGTARLCDLGLMRPLEHGLTVTEAATVMGTPAYMAPEQATGAELTAATDVYALGLTLWECLTGEVPLHGDSAVATLVKRQRQRPPRLRSVRPETPAWLARLLVQMLDPDPRRRPPAIAVEQAFTSHRVRIRPPWRAIAAAFLAVAVGASAFSAWRAARRGETVRLETAAQTISGYDAAGRRTWSIPLDNPILQKLDVDLDGDGRDEVVVSTAADWSSVHARAHDLPAAEILAVDTDGRVVTEVRPRDLLREWPYRYPMILVPSLMVLDLDHDGAPEVVAECRQATFYPTVLLVYWSRLGVWRPVAFNPGYVADLAAAPPGTSGIRFLAYNNLLGTLLALGELSVTPEVGADLRTIPTLYPLTHTPGAGLLTAYTIVPQQAGQLASATPRVTYGSDGGATVEIGETSIHLDRWGNPAPGPNVGRDLRDLRLAFLGTLTLLDASLELPTAARVHGILEEASARFAPLLDEDAYRAILAVKGARALAAAGEAREAITLLRTTRTSTPYDEVNYRLAHLEAIASELTTARDRLVPLTVRQATPRTYDVVQLLAEIAIARRDETDLARWVTALSAGLEGGGWTSALLARADLWWDRPTDTDESVHAWIHAPDGDAVAVLCRWRRGENRTEDPDAMHRGAKDNPDAEQEYRLAEAAALLGTGHPTETMAMLDDLRMTLDTPATYDFSDAQLLELTRGILAKALLAAGEGDRARAVALNLLATATPDLLPAILAREVLNASPEGSSGS